MNTAERIKELKLEIKHIKKDQQGLSDVNYPVRVTTITLAGFS
jgi:hypothetical protein